MMFNAQVRYEGDGWTTVGWSPSHADAARIAARAYAAHAPGRRPVEVRVVTGGSGG
jgi:alkanesulfonate monooxygenase SsuD/methylene tetrahydromethanopterin reductase-like flavin-dependent oxidoreductase (luciferase family)